MRQEQEPYNQEQYEAYGQYTYEYQSDPSQQDPAMVAARAKAAHGRKRTNGFLKFLILLCIVTVALVVVEQLVFRLETVYVVGNDQKTPQQIVTASGLVRGRNMLGIEEAEVAAAMAKDHTLIFKGMQKEYPSTIYLYIEERKTAAAMQWLGMLYTLDREGMVMTEANSSLLPQGIPLVTGMMSNGIVVGQKFTPRNGKQMEAYQRIMEELELQLYANQVSEINLADPDNLYLVTAEGVTVRLGDSRYMQAKIGAIRTDMAYLRQLGKTGGILDVTTPEDAKYMPEN